VGPGQQDLRGGQGAESGFGGDQAGGHVPGDRGDLGLDPGGGPGEAGDPLAEPGQGLVQDAGLPVSSGRAVQGGACAAAPFAGQVAELLAQRGGRGDQDGGQGCAGALAGRDSVVAAGHQQPQRLAVPVGAHLGWVRAGEQLAGGADGGRSGRSCPRGACPRARCCRSR
jgi:hypothetical protein